MSFVEVLREGGSSFVTGAGAEEPRPFWRGRANATALGLAFAAFVATRLLTLARDPWEWDEALFVDAAREGIDVRLNHPHPPGYPLFALLSRLLVVSGVSPFPAVLAVAAGAGLLAVPILAALACEIGGRERAVVWGALLWALTPSVWLHSVRPLSDAPAAAAFFLAGVALLRTAREPSHARLVGAALAAAVCFGIRPQVGAALLPASIWAATRVVRARGGAGRVLLTGLAGAAAALLAYVPVIASSGGLEAYVSAIRIQAEYVRRFDAPGLVGLLRPELWRRWLIDPFGSMPAGLAVWTAAFVGVWLRPWAAGRAIVLFGPLAFFSIPALAAHTAPRYGLGFIALPCLLAAQAVAVAGRRRPKRAAAFAVGLLALVPLPAVPALVEVSSALSPATAAVAALRSPDLATRTVAADGALIVHAQAGLGRPFSELDGARPLPPGAAEAVVRVDGIALGLAPLRVFRYRDPLLPVISRGRYLEVGIYDGFGIGSPVLNVSGEESWADEEGDVHLAEGASLCVTTSVPELRVRARTWTGSAGARLELVSAPRAASMSFVPGAGELEVGASGTFQIRVAEGSIVLKDVRVEGRGPVDLRAAVEDGDLPVAVDDPAEGIVVDPPVVVRGWCQLAGGGRLEPAEFWLDGERVLPDRVERQPRPDVSAVRPEVGDASSAGWRAWLPEDAVTPGPHELRVVFTGGGRWRAYPVRRFVVRGTGAGLARSLR
ncbi:MAG TPA: hypothetical protein PLL76_23305 [Thermoanaerobaculia bacterium]|nr:hypothetical protein [Thermoanaerobaculia bacterium]